MSQKERRARLREKFAVLAAVLDERGRRLWAVPEARALGPGGQPLVAQATGLSRRTIDQGLRALAHLSGDHQATTQRVRSPGGGRKPLTEHDPTLFADLDALVEPPSRGDPESPWRWTGKSVRQLAAELQRQGQKVGRHKVAALLAALAYRLQGNRQTKEGTTQPDRNAPFAHINVQVAACQQRGPPVVSVDPKKKERVGDCKNGGRAWRPQGDPALVRPSDCADTTLGKGNPYGVYDQTANVGWVSVGVDHDTAACAVESIQRGGTTRGACHSQDATERLMTAAGGGSNGRRSRRWKVALQRLADATG